MLALLACGEGPGRGQHTIPGEAAETSRRDELMSQAEQDRRVDYIEFLSTNIEETKRFYSRVFGWEFTDYGPDYTSFTDGRLGGGFSVASEVGQIVRQVFEFPGGRRFHFTDPSGNELAVWSDR
jgi:predicted enzyme related to lactoylglutathione lyase